MRTSGGVGRGGGGGGGGGGGARNSLGWIQGVAQKLVCEFALGEAIGLVAQHDRRRLAYGHNKGESVLLSALRIEQRDVDHTTEHGTAVSALVVHARHWQR